MTAITIPKGFKVTPEQFDELAIFNTDVRMEMTAQGGIEPRAVVFSARWPENPYPVWF